MENFLLATKNKGKIAEIKAIIDNYSFISLNEMYPNITIEETGLTLEENALIKAKTVAKCSEIPVIAEDSGLFVDCLNGSPGIYSARFAGENATDEENIQKLLNVLKSFPPNPTARFVCCSVIVYPDGKTFISEGILQGTIYSEKCGIKGFGYDPIFFLPSLNRTMAEISFEQKNLISHRALSFKNLIKKISNI